MTAEDAERIGADVEAARAALYARLPGRPTLFLVAGSGLSGLADLLEDAVRVPFADVPGIPEPAVAGHPGAFVFGRLERVPALVQLGRLHLYEGHAPELVAVPARVAAALGVRAAILTNAAGAIHPLLEPGDLLLIDDHINLMWGNPLLGRALPGEERFPDMSEPYDRGLQALAMAAALELQIPLKRGTYAAVAGPSYETPAEIRMLRRLGADAVGMSTVPEVLAARARGVPALAISLLTNRAAGLSPGPLSHEEVLEAGRRAEQRLGRLIRQIARRIAERGGEPAAAR
ncbi:MAG: purine-nucleoside phosphorylase [Gemmatimonadetes bacterium]|nr:purine-nucleoside phosphorylase [Gemmatimonadota bacterium]